MKLIGKTIATLIAEDVEDLEYYVPLMRLEEEGATVLSATLEKLVSPTAAVANLAHLLQTR